MASSSYTDAVLLFGDSLTQSWASGSIAQRMAEYYSRKLDVINRGFSGYTTRWALPVFEQIFASTVDRIAGHAQNVKLMTIWFGANDSVLPGNPQYVPIKEYKANLSQIISLVRSDRSPYFSPDTKIVMITPPPVIEKIHYEKAKASAMEAGTYLEPFAPTRTKQNTDIYVTACCKVAETENVPVVNMKAAIIAAAGGEADEQLKPYFTDGLHLTSAGYEVLYRKLTELVASTYPELGSETTSMRMPSYNSFFTDEQEGYDEIAELSRVRAEYARTSTASNGDQ